ncbi:uncharacterized protein LOC128984314 [Macrosteles quadrilineatus]|uniref:uncharacterized protein LOC128984314 n=1 Tax=Macrosteles quadrilineatus TaxID=74068 RepID=UPI0023E0966F|nr:uncharacterized protein LOC128984314 [Macrosteles quadrilineatus]
MEPLTNAVLGTLAEGKDLNDGVINHFFHLLQRRGQENDEKKKVMSFPTHFFVRWDRENAGYEGVASWVKENPMIKDILFFPIHVDVGNGHWALIVARPQHRDIVSFDSLGLEHNRRMEQVKEFLEKDTRKRKRKSSQTSWSTLNMLTACPQQKNTHDCGVFVCLFADLLMREQSLKTLQTLTSRELREILKRKIKWMGLNQKKLPQKKKQQPRKPMQFWELWQREKT